MKLQFITMPGCHTCAKVKKTIEEIKPNFPDLEIEEVDMTAPEGQEMVQKHSIMSSPGIIIDGELFSTGGVSKEKLVDALRQTQH